MLTLGTWVRRWSPACAAALWLAIPSWGAPENADPPAAVEPRPALDVKQFLAVLLAKVPPYVRWPDAAFATPNEPFVIGFLGADPTEGLLAALVQPMRVDGREVVVKTFASADEIAQCQMLYVPSARADEWEAASRKTALPHVLAIGETEDFAKAGGVLVVSAADRKLHVFLANARKARLEVDARLLRLAKVHR